MRNKQILSDDDITKFILFIMITVYSYKFATYGYKDQEAKKQFAYFVAIIYSYYYLQQYPDDFQTGEILIQEVD